MKRNSPSDLTPKVMVRLSKEAHAKLSDLARREKRSRGAQAALYVERALQSAAA